jgi:hypothetical protein
MADFPSLTLSSTGANVEVGDCVEEQAGRKSRYFHSAPKYMQLTKVSFRFVPNMECRGNGANDWSGRMTRATRGGGGGVAPALIGQFHRGEGRDCSVGASVTLSCPRLRNEDATSLYTSWIVLVQVLLQYLHLTSGAAPHTTGAGRRTQGGVWQRNRVCVGVGRDIQGSGGRCFPQSQRLRRRGSAGGPGR